MNKLRLTQLLTAILLMAGILAHATQLTAGRDTPFRTGEKIAVAVAQNEHIYVGAMVCISNILAYEARDVSGYAILGVALNEVDQTGDAYDATKKVTVARGIARFINGGTYTLADMGKFCYISDDQTVTTAATASSDIPCGIIVDVDSSGVWVDIGSLNRALSGSFDDLVVADDGSIGDDLSVVGDLTAGTATVTGAATLSSTLDVTGAITGASTLDVDSITVDAAAGIDTQAAGELKVGAATATSLTLGASDITTSVAGPFVNPRLSVTRLDAASLVLTSAHYGTMICVSNTAAVAITLPANGAAAGSWIDVSVYSASTDDCVPTISAATADTLIGPNDIDLDSVTWATSHRIGAYARFWSDGAKWHVLNLGGTTMTYTD